MRPTYERDFDRNNEVYIKDCLGEIRIMKKVNEMVERVANTVTSGDDWMMIRYTTDYFDVGRKEPTAPEWYEMSKEEAVEGSAEYNETSYNGWVAMPTKEAMKELKKYTKDWLEEKVFYELDEPRKTMTFKSLRKMMVHYGGPVYWREGNTRSHNELLQAVLKTLVKKGKLYKYKDQRPIKWGKA